MTSRSLPKLHCYFHNGLGVRIRVDLQEGEVTGALPITIESSVFQALLQPSKQFQMTLVLIMMCTVYIMCHNEFEYNF